MKITPKNTVINTTRTCAPLKAIAVTFPITPRSMALKPDRTEVEDSGVGLGGVASTGGPAESETSDAVEVIAISSFTSAWSFFSERSAFFSNAIKGF